MTVTNAKGDRSLLFALRSLVRAFGIQSFVFVGGEV